MYKRKGVINFVLIGAKSTGKTCYIENLSDNGDITASNDTTIEYIASIKKDGNNQHQGTSATYTELYFNYTKGAYNIDFQIDDYDGNFVETWHSSVKNQEYKKRLTEYVRESEGIFVFLSYEKKDDVDDRFKNMRRETDALINRIEKEYPEEHRELPIPLIIVVSKWDDSQPFPLNENDEYQQEKAREYIEIHDVLKKIKEKLDKRFKKIDIIPLSSTEGYNITLPIELALKYTFEAWENKIEELKDSKEELLIFLNSISYDIRRYKNGEYGEELDNLNDAIVPSYIKELQDLKTIKEFEDYCDKAYKNDKGESIIDAFNEKDTKDIEAIKIKLTYEEWENKVKKLQGGKNEKELLILLTSAPQDILHYKNREYEKKLNELKKKEFNKKLLWAAFVIIVLAASILGYSNYKTTKGEEKLFHNIQTEFENKNFSAVLSNIKIYNAEYSGVHEKHYDTIKLLEEQAKAKYREEIGRVLAKLPEIKSVAKACGTIGKINIKAREYEVPPATLSLIQKEFFRLDEINRAYEKANEEIARLSLGSISKEKIDDIARNKSKLIEFAEYQTLEKKFDAKIQTVLNASFESDDENTLELMLDVASSMKIADDKISALKERLHRIKVDIQFNEFLEQLKKIDNITDLTNKISTDWNAEYSDNKKRVETRNLVEIKYNEWIKKQLKRETPQSINNIDDYSRLDTFAREGINMQQRIKSLPVNISISMSVENKKVYDEKIKLFQRYREIFEDGVATTSLTLHIEKGNSLGITSFDDKVSIFLNGYTVYRPSDSHGFRSNKIVFSHTYKYKVQRYSMKIKETDLFDDDYETENFTITDNKLIELENRGRLHIKLGGGYAIEINK